MTEIGIPSIVREGFTLSVERNRCFQLHIMGNADMDTLPFLGPFLDKVHEAILAARERLVEVDLHKLYFMNSSCFKAVITWIATVKKSSAAPYTVRFLANPNLHWQKRNLDAIRQFAPGIVEIVVDSS
jgi:hypothetical protein